MTNEEFESLKVGDVIRNPEGLPFTIRRKTSYGYQLTIPGPVKLRRAGKACNARFWSK